MNRNTLRQVLNVVLGIAQLATNAVGGAGINGRSVGSVSDSFTTAFIPAGLTFAVWGPIYIGLTAYVVYQALPGQRDRTVHQRVGWLAAGAAACNAMWTPLFVTENFTLSLVVMLGLLTCLASIFVVLRRMRGELTMADRWAVMIPFSGYFAWITVATVANVTTTLLALGWGGAGLSDPTWAVVATVAAAAITTAMIVYSGGHAGIFAYTAVLIWAYVGVYLGNGAQYPIVGIVALGSAALVTLATAWRFWRPSAGGPARRTVAA
jgi:benzodiazapine receptor